MSLKHFNFWKTIKNEFKQNYFWKVKWFIKFARRFAVISPWKACKKQDLWRNLQTLPALFSQHLLLIYLEWHTTVHAWLFAQSILRFLFFRQYFICCAFNWRIVTEAIKASWMLRRKSRKSQENELAFNQSSDFSVILKLNYL